MGALKEAGLDRDTLVIFTSDNGGQVDLGASNGTLRGTKGSKQKQSVKSDVQVSITAEAPVTTPATPAPTTPSKS